eukprot:Em0011g1048a
MCRIFHDATTEAVLLFDANNAFNSLNRKFALLNTHQLCPSIATILTNTYRENASLFIDGDTVFSQEGTAQGDPLAMAMYAIATVPLIEKLQSTNTKQVWYADDATAGGTLLNLKAWWTMLSSSGPSYGYFVNPGKTWLIVKPQHERDAKELFSGTGIGITSEGKRHLGAALGSHCFLESYISDKVKMWTSTILNLSLIAKTQPHAAYCGFVHGVSGLWIFFLRTLPDISSFLQPLEDAIRLLPSQDVTASVILKGTFSLFQHALVVLPYLTPLHQLLLNTPHLEKSASSWLSVLPISDHGFALHKGAFRDAMCLRYKWQPPNLPSRCACRSSFNTDHALTCPTGGFPSVRHNNLRDFTANLLTELPSAYRLHERQKQRSYDQRVHEIEHGSFTPLVFTTSGGMGKCASVTYKRLASLLSTKQEQNYGATIAWGRAFRSSVIDLAVTEAKVPSISV